MKPYFAILIDSFWEAITNKILWGLLICWTLLFAGLAPFGYVTEVGYELTRGDIINPLGLAQKLAKGLAPDGNDRQKRVSSRLTAAMQEQLRSAIEKNDSKIRNDELQKIGRRELSIELNKLLKDRELFDAQVFDTVAKLETVKEIVAKEAGKRSDLDVAYLNRQVLRMTYSADMRAPRSEQIWFGYAGIKIGSQLQFDRSQINMFIEGVALQLIIRLGLSFIVVFVGLIITSSMIPETFRSGALHLLLSKPVSRPLIFLTKFFGGTLFVLINIAYLLVGMYLLVGWRLGIWNVGLIWCIPLLLFVFVIFYSVSALVGLIWNNPIISVVVCIVFWLFCFSIGVLQAAMSIPAVWMPQIVRFVKVNDDLLSVTQSSEVKVWNEAFKVWQPAAELESQGPGRVLGPIHDRERERLIMRADFLNGLGGMETRNRNLVIVELNEQEADKPAEVKPNADKPADGSKNPAQDDSTKPKTVEEARRNSRWQSDTGPEPPMLMIDMVKLGDKDIAVTRNGFFEIDWKAQELSNASKSAPSIFGDLSGWLSRVQPQVFRDLSPADYVFGDRARVVGTPDSQSIIVYNGTTIDSLRLDAEKGKLVIEHTLKIGEKADVSALIAASNNFILLGREDMPLAIIDRQLSQIVDEIPIPGKVDPRQIFVAGSSDQFSIVTHENRLHLLDATSKKISDAKVAWQGDVTGITWLDDHKAWVGIRPNRAALVDMSTGVVEQTLTPTPSRLDLFYNWIARPLYLVCPKPSSLNGVLEKLLQRERAGQTQLFNNDLSVFRQEVEIWQPIISNLLFVAVMLGIGCLYVWRKEF